MTNLIFFVEKQLEYALEKDLRDRKTWNNRKFAKAVKRLVAENFKPEAVVTNLLQLKQKEYLFSINKRYFTLTNILARVW